MAKAFAKNKNPTSREADRVRFVALFLTTYCYLIKHPSSSGCPFKHLARHINFVWNYVNELSQRSIKERGVFLSAYDMHPYTQGAGKDFGLHSQALQCIAGEYVTRRKQFKKTRLNWRKSGGVRRSLGWIPVNTGAAQWKSGQIYHSGHYFKIWDSYGLSQYKFRSGSFNGVLASSCKLFFKSYSFSLV